MAILNMNYGKSGGGGNIGEPLNLTVTTSGLNATIKWEDNEIGTIPPTTFQKSELVRKIGSAPTSPSDGDLVVTETVKDTYKTTGYVDQGLTDGETYYYRVFSYSDLGGISYCDAVSVTPSAGGWKPGVNTKVYYNINENDTNSTIFDLSGNGIDQSWSATPTYTTDANYGKVAVFDGSYYASAASRVDFGNEVTFIALCKFATSLENRARTLISQGQSSSTWATGIGEGIFGNGMYVAFCAGGTSNNVDSGIEPTVDVWYMIAGTRASDGTGKIYINGELKNTVTGLTTPTYNIGTNLTIGQRGGTYPNYFYGLFKLFIGENRCWTDEEIADLAAEYGF